jgi:hypothetical protein
MKWDQDIPFAELQQLARKLESALSAANAQALKIACVEKGEVARAFAHAHATLLRFDDFGRRRLDAALEDARVQTLAGDNLVLACVLSAAVALKQFKNQPRNVGGLLARPLAFVQTRSTGLPALWLLSVSSIYTVLGKGAAKHLSDVRKKRFYDVSG